MKLFPALLLLAASGLSAAERHHYTIDPETPEGVFLQRILQEKSAPARLAEMEQYTREYPNSASIGWIYEQMLSIYAAHPDARFFTASDRLIALDPTDVDTAASALRAADSQNDLAMSLKYARVAWDGCSRLTLAPKPPKVSDQEWAAQQNWAKDTMNFAEYSLYRSAHETADLSKKNELVEELKHRNAKGKYAQSARAEYVTAVLQTSSLEKRASFAERELAFDPDNEDLLVIAAEAASQQSNDPKSLAYGLKLLDVLARKVRPEGVGEEVWLRKKTEYTGTANFIVGIVYSKNSKFVDSDRHLKAALPFLHDKNATLAAAYYYIGYNNYALASDSRNPSFAQEALKYNQLCAAMSGPYQAPALKNMHALKTEFHVE